MRAIPYRLTLKTELHLLRKGWHVCMGSLIALLYLGGVGRWVGTAILLAFLTAFLVLEGIRLSSPKFNEACVRFWGPLMRSCEVNKMSGVPPYLASAALSIALFPKQVAVLAILYLACGDPMASLIGVVYGKHSYRFPSGKSALGAFAGVATCIALSFYFFVTQGIAQRLGVAGTVAISLFGGLMGGTVELLPIDLDDNFTIPIVSGFLLWGAFIFFGV